MGKEKIVAGFIGAGGIARSHAFALNSLKYYYNDAPEVELAAVCSAGKESRTMFAQRFGFSQACGLDDFVKNSDIDTVFILGPNKVHYEHFRAVLGMKGIKRIYLEKPVCSTPGEEASIRELVGSNPSVYYQGGFQYLFISAVREALLLWKSGRLGRPVHFDLKYYHSDYLKKEYRDKRVSRLTPAPDGGAMADLGSHAISFLIAFLGSGLRITGALQAGNFDDVPAESDLFSQISLLDDKSNAAGTLSSSRISAGTGDNLSFEFYAEKGAIRYSSVSPDFYEYYTEGTGHWIRQQTGSDYKPVTTFPSQHVPAGWHRPMIHAHYVFLKGIKDEVVIPDIEHGLQVQRLVRETADHLEKFRKLRDINSKESIKN
jgi:predicted dehydrogenase